MAGKEKLLIRLMPFLAVLYLAGCAAHPSPELFAGAGRVWPEPPEVARIQFVGELSSAADLGIHPSIWTRFASIWAGPAPDNLVRPMAIAAVGDADVIYVADTEAQCVHRFRVRDGRYDCLTRRQGALLPSPVGLAVSDDGTLFVADSRLGQILALAPGEKELDVFESDVTLMQPTGLAWDSTSSQLLVADTAAQLIRRIGIDGKQVDQVGTRGELGGEFNYPTYLWPDGAGGFYVTDSLNFRVQHVNALGEPTKSFGELGDALGDLSRPKGVAVDSFGHIYVVDALFNALQVFDEDGRLLIVVAGAGQGPGQFWLPNGIFIDAANTIYIADTYNQRIQIFRYIGGDE